MDRGRLLTDLSCLRSSSFYWMVKKRSKHKKWQVLAQKTKLAPKVHFFLHVYYENRHINMYNICIRYILVMLVLSTCNNRFMKQKHHTLQKEEKGGIIQYYIFFYLFVCLLLKVLSKLFGSDSFSHTCVFSNLIFCKLNYCLAHYI